MRKPSVTLHWPSLPNGAANGRIHTATKTRIIIEASTLAVYEAQKNSKLLFSTSRKEVRHMSGERGCEKGEQRYEVAYSAIRRAPGAHHICFVPDLLR